MHAPSDYFRDAKPCFHVEELDERFVDEPWIERTPKYRRYLGWPVTIAMGLRRRANS